jgi:hypothetical protein
MAMAERRLARLDIDLFGYNPLNEPFQLVRCLHCHLAVRPARFESHLARCAASRRAELAVAADFGRSVSSASAANANTSLVTAASTAHVASVSATSISLASTAVPQHAKSTVLASTVVARSTVAAATPSVAAVANPQTTFFPTTVAPTPTPTAVTTATTMTSTNFNTTTTTNNAAIITANTNNTIGATASLLAEAVAAAASTSLADMADAQRLKRKFDIAVANDDVSNGYHSAHKQRVMPHEVFLNQVAELSVSNRSMQRTSLNRLLTQVQMLEPQPAASYQYSRRKPLRSLLLSGFVPPTPRSTHPSSATSTTSSPDEHPLELETDALLSIAFSSNS